MNDEALAELLEAQDVVFGDVDAYPEDKLLAIAITSQAVMIHFLAEMLAELQAIRAELSNP